MHRQITNAPPHLVCDHIDHNGLNNTKINLRLCTPAQNSYNRRKKFSASLKYKGIYWNRKYKKWYASIEVNYRTYYLGRFDNPLEAAKAYDNAAMKYHGEFACLNFPNPNPAP